MRGHAVAAALAVLLVSTFADPGEAEAGRIAGIARTASAGPSLSVAVPPSPEPEPLRPEEALLRSTRLEWEREINPVTPVDPNATIRIGTPIVPEKTVTIDKPHGPRAANDFTTFVRSDLGTTSTSQVSEPSAGSNGPNALMTWNWYAAMTQNNGASWSYWNPETMFPSAYGGFCCDQVALYEPSRDIYVWILQYDKNTTGNGIRIAIANGTTDLAAGAFHYWTITPQQAGAPNGSWFDQPKLATSNNQLWMEVSQYNQADAWERSLVLHFSLSTLASGGSLGFSYFDTSGFSPALTRGATSSMWFAQHQTTSTLRLFRWDEGSGTIYYNDVSHVSYPAPQTHRCLRSGAAPTSDWCQRGDPRIFAGWIAGGTIGFMWSAPQGNGGFGSFPYPYIHIVRANTGFGYIDSTAIWNSGFAFQHPSVAPNASGEIGGTYLWGGGSERLNCGAFVNDSVSGGAYHLFGETSSTADPTSPVAGDYLSSAVSASGSRTWTATCYSLTGATVAVHPYYLVFGREGNAPPPGAPGSLTATAGPGRGQISLSWQAASGTGIQRYEVFRNGGYVGQTTGLSYVDSGLADGTTHSYQVAAVNAGGRGPFSNTASATTMRAPSEPRSVSAAPGTGPNQIRVSWTEPLIGPAQSYNVCRSTSASGPWTCIGVGAVTAWTDFGRPALQTNYYYVTAQNAIGVSPPSPVVCSKPMPWLALLGC